MASHSKSEPKIRESIPAHKVQDAIQDLLDYLLRSFDFSSNSVAFVGIHTRGVTIAHRLADRISREKNVDVPVGAIDITLYRDDFNTGGLQPVVAETELDFPIDDRHIVLVDDVLFTGRTVRAALDEIMDFGRPKSVTLVTLVDRGHRELPIQADFAPLKIQTKKNESVKILLNETDEKDGIVVYEAMP